MKVLQDYPIDAIDVVEVETNYDQSERTQRLEAEVLLQFVMDKH